MFLSRASTKSRKIQGVLWSWLFELFSLSHPSIGLIRWVIYFFPGFNFQSFNASKLSNWGFRVMLSSRLTMEQFSNCSSVFCVYIESLRCWSARWGERFWIVTIIIEWPFHKTLCSVLFFQIRWLKTKAFLLMQSNLFLCLANCTTENRAWHC